MQPREPLLKRTIERLRLYRYKWFGKAPSDREWEDRLARVIAVTVEQSLPWIPPEGGAFLDVGANIGLYTETILRARPSARAWLFEPVRAHYEKCAARFAGMPNVVVENFALGDRAERVTIWKPKHNPGGNVIDAEIVARRRGYMDFRPEEIEIRVFDDYAREKGITRVDFVKSDAEGFDYRVLRGMLGFLARSAPKPAIVAELLRADIHPDYEAQLALLDELYALGYRKVDLAGMDDVQDFVFVPEGR
jgi:FkbM family methyltransferase